MANAFVRCPLRAIRNAGGLMAGIEIRNYEGDFEDVVELTRQVWVPEYGGRTWVPIPDAAFLRWKLAPQSGAVCPVAYEGTKLVGTVFSVPHALRIGETVYPVAMCTGFTVAPEHRRLALPLIERLRRAGEERGLAFGIGMVLDDPNSASYRFWTKYADAFPQNFRFVFRGGYWGKFLAPHVLARAAIEAWERMASRALGPLLRFTPYGYGKNVRRYRAADLERCAQILEKSSAGLDWAMSWKRQQLSAQLENPEYTTLVLERDGKIRGMVNSHYFSLHGRELIRAAMIDLWTDDDMTGGERVRLLSHLCAHLREQDVHAVVAARSAVTPATTFLANVFVPASQNFQIGVFPTRRSIPFTPPKTWNLEIT
jgi:hypothetical protein